MSQISDDQAIENSPEAKEYYDNKRLFYTNVFWLVCGGSAALFGAQTAQTLMPLHMAKIGMNPEQISFALAMKGWIGVPILLYVAYISDRWQSKMGRRLPFLAITLPFVVAGMVIFPFMSTAAASLTTYIIYFFWMQVKYDTYPYLIYDIGKRHFWGRTLAANSICGAIAVFCGQHFLMPLADKHGEKVVFFISAAFVLGATCLMLLFLKEPPIRSKEKPTFNPIPVMADALKIGFSDKRNIWLFVTYAFVSAQLIIPQFISLQAHVNLGLTTGEVGTRILQYGTIVTIAALLGAGLMIDKLGAAASMLIGYAISITAVFIGFHPASATMLAVAYAFSVAGSAVMINSAMIFLASGTERKNLATFTSCGGAVNLLTQSLVIFLAGIFIRRVFANNYGLAFIISGVFITMAIPMIIWLEKFRRKERREMDPSAALILEEEPNAG